MLRSLPDINIAFSKKKSLLAVGLAAITLACLYFYLDRYFRLENAKFLLILFFGGPVLLVVMFIRIIRSSSVIKLNSTVLWWKGQITDDEFTIPWHVIQKFEINGDFFLNKSIRVFVEHPEHYVWGNWSRIQKQKSKILTDGTHLAIPLTFLEQSPEEMLVILKNYLDTVKGKPGAMVMPQL